MFERHTAFVAIVEVAARTHIRFGFLAPDHIGREAFFAPYASASIEFTLTYDAVSCSTVQAKVQPEGLVYEALCI